MLQSAVLYMTCKCIVGLEKVLVHPDGLISLSEKCWFVFSFRHIYAIANAAFQSLLRTEHKQAIVISGESGAGKTESARLLIEFLAANQADGSLVINQV